MYFAALVTCLPSWLVLAPKTLRKHANYALTTKLLTWHSRNTLGLLMSYELPLKSSVIIEM